MRALGTSPSNRARSSGRISTSCIRLAFPVRPGLNASAAVVEDVRDVRERIERQVQQEEDHSPDEGDRDGPGDRLADLAVPADPLLEVRDRAEERRELRVLSTREAPRR